MLRQAGRQAGGQAGRQATHLTSARMKADLPTLAAPITYTSRPRRSRRMAATAAGTPAPLLLLTCRAGRRAGSEGDAGQQGSNGGGRQQRGVGCCVHLAPGLQAALCVCAGG